MTPVSVRVGLAGLGEARPLPHPSSGEGILLTGTFEGPS